MKTNTPNTETSRGPGASTGLDSVPRASGNPSHHSGPEGALQFSVKIPKNASLLRDKTAVCPDCKNPKHEPGLSEFSNCGESDITRSRDDFSDPFEKNDKLGDMYQ